MGRALPYDVSIEDVLTDLLEYMEDRQDADHDGDGFVPNKEMRFATEISQALFQLQKPAEKDFFTGMPFGGKQVSQALSFDNDPPIIL